MILLPISQGRYSSSVIWFLVSGGGEDDNNSSIAGCVHPPCDIVINILGEEDMIPHRAGGVHPAWDIVPNIHGEERLMLLPIWQGVYIHPVIFFLIFQG